MLAHLLEVQGMLFCSISTLHLPNCVIVVWLYVFSLLFVFVFATNCSIVALGNNILYVYNGITFPSLPMSTLYGTMIMTLFVEVFRFAIIIEQLELNLTEFIFTILISVSCTWSMSHSILWTTLLLELLHTSLKWFMC